MAITTTRTSYTTSDDGHALLLKIASRKSLSVTQALDLAVNDLARYVKPRKMKGERNYSRRSFTVRLKTKGVLDGMAGRLGISSTATLELAIRAKAREEGLRV
jgi:hypothetical protein